MEFQKLRLTGFKSFVEPTDFEIRPGLTGIVGPNGCGKSNLLEALRWVMGATSAKALRAGGMEDVIFSGTGTVERTGRPARSWAEVSLQIGNEDRTAPAEYNDHPHLEITRRITKKGDGASSTYRINGKEVRAKDVQLLFADAATGANSPALVRQGQVSDLINAKPENRRKFLEEAAGVTGLYQRRHEAELRLRAAATNLERLDDVVAELEQQRGLLARQARQATRYRNIAGQLKKAEALLAYARWAEARDQVEAAETQLSETRNELEEAARAAASATAAREKAHTDIEPLRMKEAEAAAALHRLQVEQENFEKELDRARAEIERLNGDRERLERELARERDLGSDAAQALEALAAEEEQLRHREAAEADRLSEADRAVDAAQAVLTEAEARVESAQRALAEAQAETRAQHAARERAERSHAALEQELARAKAELGSLGDNAATDGELAGRKARLAELQEALSQTQAAIERAGSERAAAEREAEAAQGPRDDAMAAVNATQAEVDTLRRVLASSEPDGQRVLDEISVDEGFEAALAAALGEDLEASDEAGNPRHWSVLGTQPLSTSLPQGVGSLADHVRAPAALARRLASIGVVEPDLGESYAAQLQPGQRLVSRDGDLWRWDGFVARAGAKTAAAARLEQTRRLGELEQALDAVFADRDTAERQLADAKARLAAARDAEREARKTSEQVQTGLRETERDIARMTAELDRNAAKRDALAGKLEDLQRRLDEAETERAQAVKRAADLPDLGSAEAALGELRNVRDEARNANGRARAKRADLRRDADARQARLGQITEQREGWDRRQGNATQRIQSVSQTLEETTAALGAAEGVPSRLEERRESLYESVAAAESRRRHAADALAELQSRTVDADRASKVADEAAALARENKARAEAMAEAARARLADVTQRAAEVHDGPPEDLLAIAEHAEDAALPDQEQLETKVDRLKREREGLGGVNLCADEEMAEIDQRLDEIQKERADCEAAIAKLRGAIGSLNRDGRQRLLDAFEKVNANFTDLFMQLFGGGQAELRLVDSDDPLEAGLEIFASPPGKKLTSMSLMSGGEQALTATALIFAVFRSNPAPVCVLDEVDAPLDDANTDRFCAMLARMAEETNTRFIAITHHPLTMSRMDRLYGVTMVERGVSQLVSVDLAEAEKMAA
jgi:chromosome segregation protein